MAKEPDYPESVKLTDPETGEEIISPSLIDLEEHMAMMRNYLTPDGAERPDPTPIAPPVGYRRQPSLIENMRAMIREHAVAMALAGQEAETFEEADDFDVADDFDPHSPWENQFDPPVSQINQEEAAKNAAAKAAQKPPAAEPPPAPAEQPKAPGA